MLIALFLIGLLPTAFAVSPPPLSSPTPKTSPTGALTGPEVPDVFLVRHPSIIECKTAGKFDAAIGFDSKTEAISHRIGEKFLILLPTGETRVGEILDQKKTIECATLGAESVIAFARLKVDRPFTWPGPKHELEDALIAVGAAKPNRIQVGTIYTADPPELVKMELNKLAIQAPEARLVHSAQLISPPGVKRKFGLVHTQIFPKNYDGGHNVTHYMSFWEIEGGNWKFVSKNPGDFRFFSITSLLGDGRLEIGVSENDGYSGTYKLREFKNGALGEVIRTFYKWMD
jgi:hypothetical protein